MVFFNIWFKVILDSVSLEIDFTTYSIRRDYPPAWEFSEASIKASTEYYSKLDLYSDLWLYNVSFSAFSYSYMRILIIITVYKHQDQLKVI